MESLIIEGTATTLQVKLVKEEGLFEFKGRSRPENIVAFFEPIFEWFNKYKTEPNSETIIKFDLDYFNSSSAKVLLRFFSHIEEMVKNGINIKIHWLYITGDEDLLEAGEDFADIISIPFKFIEYED